MSGGIAPNYQYWRDHGGTWAGEYARRKTRMVLYHIQEIMLAQYVLEHAKGRARPLRVLEFGCGVGRHLAYLKDLPGVEIHGFDQSETMAGSVRAWAGPDWCAQRVTTGPPTGRLPYGNGAFDLVFTAEVLVHVRPEDLSGTLAELCRVCRGHVLHLETSPDFPVFEAAHSGCWKHDLPVAYERLGKRCEVLERGYRAHSPYRVTLGEPPAFSWAPPLLAMFRAMEQSIDRGFEAGDAAAQAERDPDPEPMTDSWRRRAGELQVKVESLADELAAMRERHSRFVAAIREALG